MRGKISDYTGQTIGNCVVKSEAGRTKHGAVLWDCVCKVCGASFTARSDAVKRGVSCSTSCGVAASNITRATHGKSRHPDYKLWSGIKQRCYNPKAPNFHRYGGRGIKMHVKWVKDFAKFSSYIQSLPNYGKPGMTLDRIDNNRGYMPGNLRWSTRKEQALNRYNNVRITIDGETKTIAEWAEFTGLGQTLKDRYYAGKRGAALLLPKKEQ